MDNVILTQMQPDPRPYGLFGLIISLAGLALIATAALALGLGVIALGDFLLHGWPHLLDSFRMVAALPQGANMEDLTKLGIVLGAAIYVSAILALWAMARLRAGKGWPLLLGWTPFEADRTYWALLLTSLVYGPLASLVVGYFHPAAKKWFVVPDSPWGLGLAFFLVVVLAPLAEELFFRGWLYTALRWRFGFAGALWTTAILFALAHWESTHLYALAILPMGLVLGYLRERTGSTRATTLFHMLYNLSGLALSILAKV